MPGIFITLGRNYHGNAMAFGLQDSDHPDVPSRLIMRELDHDKYEGLRPIDTDLGPATTEHFDKLIGYMTQLRIHMEDS